MNFHEWSSFSFFSLMDVWPGRESNPGLLDRRLLRYHFGIVTPWFVESDVSWWHLLGIVSDWFIQCYSSRYDEWFDGTLTSIHLRVSHLFHLFSKMGFVCRLFGEIQIPSYFPGRSSLFSFSLRDMWNESMKHKEWEDIAYSHLDFHKSLINIAVCWATSALLIIQMMGFAMEVMKMVSKPLTQWRKFVCLEIALESELP